MKTVAFWDYDLFPFLLWGEVGKVLDDGKVVIPSYGNAVFTPKLILPKEKAHKLIAYLDGMKDLEHTLRSLLRQNLACRLKEYGIER